MFVQPSFRRTYFCIAGRTCYVVCFAKKQNSPTPGRCRLLQLHHLFSRFQHEHDGLHLPNVFLFLMCVPVLIKAQRIYARLSIKIRERNFKGNFYSLGFFSLLRYFYLLTFLNPLGIFLDKLYNYCKLFVNCLQYLETERFLVFDFDSKHHIFLVP